MQREFIFKNKKYFFIGSIIILFLLIRFFVLRPPSDDIIYIVKNEDLIDTVQTSGIYNSSSQTEVYSPTNGILSKIYVNNGDFVKKEDPLFHVESTADESKQKETYANYLSAKATVESDKAKLYSLQSTMFSAWKKYTDKATDDTYENSDGSPNKDNRIVPEFATVQDDWLAAEANYKNQQSIIAKDEAALSSAYLDYSQTQSTTVKAQASGTINNFLKKDGDDVSINNDPVLVISGQSKPYLESSIGEEYATRIDKGQSAIVVFDALKDKKFVEKVEEIGKVGVENNGITTYKVRLSAKNITSPIKTNMSALVTIETLKKENVLTVPNSAITVKEGQSYVTGSKNKNLISVVTGIKGLVKTEILKGLRVGDKILANPS